MIIGASGSIGTFAVQLAKLLGAQVTGVCSAKNVELVTKLGADHVIDYTKEDYTKNPIQYDIVFDTVGKSSFRKCQRILKPGGSYLPTVGLHYNFSMLFTKLKAVFFGISRTKKVFRPGGIPCILPVSKERFCPRERF